MGIAFVWLGSLDVQYYWPTSCPFAIAASVSAITIWITAGQLRSLRRNP